MKTTIKGTPEPRTLANTVLMLAILLLAYALRVYRLDGQSFWSDEGATVTMAGRNVAEIAKAAASDIHPPLYYVLVHWWSLPTGTSEFAMRYLSVAFGLLLVALLFRLGARLLNHGVGISGALVASFAPFLVYYSQEARMYAQMTFLTALSVYLFLLVVAGLNRQADFVPSAAGQDGSGPEPRRLVLLWLGYVLVTAAALYTQYFAFSIILFEDLVFVVWQITRWRGGVRAQARVWALWLGGQALVALLYIPWLAQSFQQLTGWPSISESFGLATLLQRLFLIFSFGLSWDMTATSKAQIVYIMILAASSLWLAGRWFWSDSRKHGELVAQLVAAHFGRTSGYGIACLYLAVPVLAMYLLSLQRPMYNPKLLLLVTPPYYLLLGLGVYSLAHTSRAVLSKAAVRLPWEKALFGLLLVAGIALMGFFTVRSLQAYFGDPKYARDDYRGLARTITISQQEGDAILLNAPGQQEIFGYYYHGSQPIYPLPKQRPIDEAVTAQDLTTLAAKHQRVWVVYWAVDESDPHGFIEAWLNRHGFKTDSRWFGSVRLVLYSFSNGAESQINHPLQFVFGDQIRLQGYNLASAVAGAEQARAGEVLRLTLFWQAIRPLEQRYTVFTHLIDDREFIWGQRDSEPGGGTKLTTTWQPREVISDNYGIPVYLGTPPGEYKVELGLYNASDGRRLPVQGAEGQPAGDRVILGPIRLGRASRPPDLASLFVEHATDTTLGPLHLIGYDLQKLGYDRGNVDFRPGDIAHLTLYWQAPERPGGGYTTRVQLVDKNGKVVFNQESAPAGDRYPTAQWEKGEVVRDQYKIPLSLDAGQYRLMTGLRRDDQIIRGGKIGDDGLFPLAVLEVQPR